MYTPLLSLRQSSDKSQSAFLSHDNQNRPPPEPIDTPLSLKLGGEAIKGNRKPAAVVSSRLVRSFSSARHLEHEDEKPHVTPSLRFGWWWELGAMLVSVTSTSFILAVLVFMNNKSLESWKLPIQISSLIAVFSTFAKSALLVALSDGLSQLKWHHFERRARTMDHLQYFHDASKGPWGSFIFFWKMRKSRVSPIAAAGAILTIAALMFEPFTQQILAFSTRPVLLMNETASVTSASGLVLNKTDMLRLENGNQTTDPFKLVTKPRNLLQAVQHSIAMSPPDVEFDITCPSNTCQMPEHWSLTTCVECLDESLPDSQSVAYQYEIMFDAHDLGISLADRHREFFTDARELKKRVGSINDTTDIVILWRPKVTTSGDEDRLPEDVLAAERAYYIFGSSNVLFSPSASDTVEAPLQGNDVFKIMEWRTFVPSPPLPSPGNLSDWEGSVLQKRTCRATLCSRYVEESQVQGGSIPPTAKKYVPLDIAKRVEQDLADQTFTAVPRGYPDGPTFEIQGLPLSLIIEDAATVLNDSIFETLRQCVNQTVSFNGLMVGLSASINTYLTSPTNTKSQSLPGQVFGSETYVIVRWPWALTPCLIVVSSLVFLIATIINSKGKEPLFKSSVLAGYFHGLEGWSVEELDRIGEDLRATGREEELTERGKALRARLMRTERNLKFVKSD